MKKTSLIFSLLAISLIGKAQQLPKKVTITFTDKQVLRMDSAFRYASGAFDSKAATKWFQDAFEPFYKQINGQLIKSDSTSKPVKK